MKGNSCKRALRLPQLIAWRQFPHTERSRGTQRKPGILTRMGLTKIGVQRDQDLKGGGVEKEHERELQKSVKESPRLCKPKIKVKETLECSRLNNS